LVIDPDFRIHASDLLLENMMVHSWSNQGRKAMAGSLIGLPRRAEDYSDRERLALRFEQFKKSA
jgi:hypothetical protein